MNAKNIESRFAAIGARLKVREIAPEWRRRFGRQRTEDYAVDLCRDCHGQFFELRVPDTPQFWHRVIMTTETQSRTMANVAFLD